MQVNRYQRANECLYTSLIQCTIYNANIDHGLLPITFFVRPFKCYGDNLNFFANDAFSMFTFTRASYWYFADILYPAFVQSDFLFGLFLIYIYRITSDLFNPFKRKLSNKLPTKSSRFASLKQRVGMRGL